jgi:two-component system, cell cycle sensor histidine kinase and response regulator CckA
VFLDSKGQRKACEVIRDITERKLAEEALHESQEKYRMVVENANEAIVVAQEGVARFTNRMAQELVGYPEEIIK